MNTNNTIPARTFFSLIKSNENFYEWMAERIENYEMKENEDYYIVLNEDAARKIIEYENLQVSI